MQFEFNDNKPIYLQIASQIEEAIITGGFEEEQQIPSTTKISKQFHINPATVLKGMNLVVSKGLLEKKRGLGMFVVAGAREKIMNEKRNDFFNTYIKTVINEAINLNISEAELITMIKRGFNK